MINLVFVAMIMDDEMMGGAMGDDEMDEDMEEEEEESVDEDAM